MARVRNTFWKKQIDKLVQSENIPVVFKQYINFGFDGGETGYGFRDEAGTIQWKNSGGSWQNIGTGGSGGHTIEDEGTPLTQRTKLNFVGAGVTVTDDAGDDATVVTITSGGGGAVDSVNGETGVVVLTTDDISDTAQTNKWATAAEKTKLGHISVTQAVDLDAIEAASHAAVTVTDSAEIDFTLAGQNITASIVAGSIDETKLDASVNASLDLADNSVQKVASTDNALVRFDGTGGVVQDGTISASDVTAGAVTLSSIGNNDLVLQTGNATTGSITITDGANGNIVVAPNGSGDIILGKPGWSGEIRPHTNDGAALGATTDAFSDLYLASGGQILSPDSFAIYDTGASISRFSFSSNNTYNVRTGGEHRFSVNSSQVAVINANGRLGLGTASPQRNLHVASSGTAVIAVERVSATTSSILLAAESGNTGIYSRSTEASTTAVPLLFYLGNTEQARFASTGEFGLGTVTPSQKLHVVGDSRIEGDIRDVKLAGFKVTSASVTGATNIDWNAGAYQEITLTGNTTLTFTAPAGDTSNAWRLQLVVKQDATGGRTLTLPSVKTPSGTAYSVSTGANDIDILTLYYDGTSYYLVDSKDFS